MYSALAPRRPVSLSPSLHVLVSTAMQSWHVRGPGAQSQRRSRSWQAMPNALAQLHLQGSTHVAYRNYDVTQCRLKTRARTVCPLSPV